MPRWGTVDIMNRVTTGRGVLCMAAISGSYLCNRELESGTRGYETEDANRSCIQFRCTWLSYSVPAPEPRYSPGLEGERGMIMTQPANGVRSREQHSTDAFPVENAFAQLWAEAGETRTFRPAKKSLARRDYKVALRSCPMSFTLIIAALARYSCKLGTPTHPIVSLYHYS